MLSVGRPWVSRATRRENSRGAVNEKLGLKDAWTVKGD